MDIDDHVRLQIIHMNVQMTRFMGMLRRIDVIERANKSATFSTVKQNFMACESSASNDCEFFSFKSHKVPCGSAVIIISYV